MKRVMLILLILSVSLVLSSCGSTKDNSQQAVMSNVVLQNPTPTPSSVLANGSASTIQPTQNSNYTPAPSSTITPEPSKPIVTATLPEASPTPASPPASAQTPDSPSETFIFIDAGHGGNDPGASGNGLIEKDVTLDIAKRLNQVLINNKTKTYMVRTGDTFIDHKERIYLANKMKASLYISIHCDWFDNSKYSGTQTFYTSAKDLRLGELTELQYAKYIHNELISNLKSNNRGIFDRPTLAAVKYANMPSILIETGFLSNPTEASNLATDAYRQKVADAMASGISQSLKKANLK